MKDPHIHNERVRVGADLFHTLAKALAIGAIVAPVTAGSVGGGAAGIAGLLVGAFFTETLAHAILGLSRE